QAAPDRDAVEPHVEMSALVTEVQVSIDAQILFAAPDGQLPFPLLVGANHAGARCREHCRGQPHPLVHPHLLRLLFNLLTEADFATCHTRRAGRWEGRGAAYRGAIP